MPRDLVPSQVEELTAAVGEALRRQRRDAAEALGEVQRALDDRLRAFETKGDEREASLLQAVRDLVAESADALKGDLGERLAELAGRPTLTADEVRTWLEEVGAARDATEAQRAETVLAAAKDFVREREAALEAAISERLAVIAQDATASAADIERRQAEAETVMREQAAAETAALHEALTDINTRLAEVGTLREDVARAIAAPRITEEEVRGWLANAEAAVAEQIDGIRALVEQRAADMPDAVKAAVAPVLEALESLRGAPRLEEAEVREWVNEAARQAAADVASVRDVLDQHEQQASALGDQVAEVRQGLADRISDEQIRELVDAAQAALTARIEAVAQKAEALAAEAVPDEWRQTLEDLAARPVLTEADVRSMLDTLAASITHASDATEAERAEQRRAEVDAKLAETLAHADALANEARDAVEDAIARALADMRAAINSARTMLEAEHGKAMQSLVEDATRQRAADLDSTRGLMTQLAAMLDKAAERIATVRDGAPGEKGDKGDPGEPGAPGPAGLLPLASMWEVGRRYERGDVVRHRGGTFQAHGDPEGAEPGLSDVWRALAEGVAEVDCTPSEDNPRSVTLAVYSSSVARAPSEFELRFAVPLYCGRYEAGRSYDRGDVVTHEFSVFIATQDGVTTEPGKGPGWSLMVGRGRKGDKGERGESGLRGERGPRGVGIREIAEEDGHLVIFLDDDTVQTVRMPVPAGAVPPTPTDADDGDGVPMRVYRGRWKLGLAVKRGDVVHYNRGLWAAAGAIPAGAIPGQHKSWVSLLTVPPGALVEHIPGGSTSAGYTQAEADDRFIDVTGDAMKGPLRLNGSPGTDDEAISKGYLDQRLKNLAPAGAAGPTVDQQARNDAAQAGRAAAAAQTAADGAKAAADAAALAATNAQAAAGTAKLDADGRVSKAGDTMTGPLVLPGDPTADLQAATKAYVDAHAAGGATATGAKVSKTGDVMTGPLTLAADPTDDAQAATKHYVDQAVAKLPAAMTYVGNADLSQPKPATLTPKSGDFVFHSGADGATVDASWLGIAGKTVNAEDAVIWDGSTEWHLLGHSATSAHLDQRFVRKAGDVIDGGLTVKGELVADGAAPRMVVEGADGTDLQIAGRRGVGKLRWTIDLGTATAEAGNNIGSDFALRCYDDAGAVLGIPIVVTRENRAITLSGPITLDGEVLLKADPVTGKQAATKDYVDGLLGDMDAGIY
jgi:hypothetical protein